MWENSTRLFLNKKQQIFPHHFVPKPQRTMAAYSKLDFEVNLNGMFKVLHGGYAILSEEPDDDQGDHFSFPLRVRTTPIRPT
ncbi:MAG: hypothetical protein HC892_15730 [Saprospiraceae bacterium]|nr:hypothetical protein [Saprospiraceae bacterium]